MTLKDLFPNVIVLSLDKRYYTHTVPLVAHMKDRFDIDIEVFLAGDGKMITERNYDHIDVPQCAPRFPNSSTYHTWQTSRCYNAWLCHNQMIRRAKQEGYNRVLLLEDDMMFEAHTETVLEQIGDTIYDTPWDFLYMGFCSFRPELTHWSGKPVILKVDGEPGIGGWHCAGINYTIYNTLINFEATACYDVLTEQILNRYIILPKLGEQKDGISSIEGGYIARENVQEKLTKLREVWPQA